MTTILPARRPQVAASYGLKQAIAWRVIASMVRAHPDQELRALETHPGGGQYRCLTLVRGTGLDLVCSMNLAGSSVLLGAGLGEPRPQDPSFESVAAGEPCSYLTAALGEDQDGLALAIEAALGFPARGSRSPRTTAPGLSTAVIAELMGRVALGERGIEACCGWHDDAWDASPCGWVEELPGVAVPGPEADWKDRLKAAARYWGLGRLGALDRPPVIVDLATSAVWVRGVAQEPLLKAYGAGLGIRELAWRVERALDGPSRP